MHTPPLSHDKQLQFMEEQKQKERNWQNLVISGASDTVKVGDRVPGLGPDAKVLQSLNGGEKPRPPLMDIPDDIWLRAFFASLRSANPGAITLVDEHNVIIRGSFNAKALRLAINSMQNGIA